MDLRPSPRQQELIDLARRLAVEDFAPRAAQYDREASFPFADYDTLHAAGLLALCVPEQYGGLGATFETYCLVAEQIAQGNASTALTFNMHCLTMMMMGEIADALPMSDHSTRSLDSWSVSVPAETGPLPTPGPLQTVTNACL